MSSKENFLRNQFFLLKVYLGQGVKYLSNGGQLSMMTATSYSGLNIYFQLLGRPLGFPLPVFIISAARDLTALALFPALIKALLINL